MGKNNKFFDLKNKICVFYKKNKKVFYSFIACFFILIVLILSTFFDISKNKKSKQINTNSISITEYASQIESKLNNMILNLKDVSKSSVFVMIETTPTISYLTETSERTETKDGATVSEKTTTVVYEKNGSISTPVVVTTLMPKVTGVLVVINKINHSTKLSIINSISVVLNIDESCISILQES